MYFFSSRRRHTRYWRDWSSDVCSSDLVYQFVKSGKWNVGEQQAAEALGNIDWFKQGDGWTWTVKDLEHSADLAREGWEEVKRRLADETYDMLLLDEFTYPMKFGWVDTKEIVEVLKNRRSEERRVGKECRSRWSPY